MGGRRDIRQRLRASKRERDDVRHRDESLLRKIYEAKRMVREARDSECNTGSKAARGIIRYISNLCKDMERDQEEAWIAGADFASAQADVGRLTSELDGVKKRYEGAEADWTDAVGGERYRRDEGNFDQRIKDLGVQGGNRVQSVTYEIDGGGRQGCVFRHYQEMVPISRGQGRGGQERGGGIDIET